MRCVGSGRDGAAHGSISTRSVRAWNINCSGSPAGTAAPSVAVPGGRTDECSAIPAASAACSPQTCRPCAAAATLLRCCRRGDVQVNDAHASAKRKGKADGKAKALSEMGITVRKKGATGIYEPWVVEESSLLAAYLCHCC